MGTMKVKEIQDRFNAMNPDDEVWIAYISKDDVIEAFANVEYTDENDELIETEPFVTTDVVRRVGSAIDDDEYLWERFNENFNDTCRELLAELIDEVREDKELWDTEKVDESIKSD